MPVTTLFMGNEEHDFKGQLKFEQFEFFFRKHWVYYLHPIFFTIPVGLLIFVILYILGRVTLLINFPFFSAFFVHFTLIVAIGYIALSALHVINYYFDMVIVTDSRVLIIKKTIFLRNNSDAIDLTKIQDISVESHGIFCNYLRYGSLIITLSTAAPPIRIGYVPNPHIYLEWCNRVKREHIVKRRTDRVQARKEQQTGSYLKEIDKLSL